MALLCEEGRWPRPDLAIFADTGWEPPDVHENIERLRAAVTFPIIIVRNGNIREDVWARARGERRRTPAVPFHLVMPDGRRAMQRRQCTDHYKLIPIKRAIRERLPKGGAAEMWLGISTDEASRMKPSRVRYILNRWPLIEAGLSRSDCEAYLRKRGWSAPKSACVCCPYRSAAEWLRMRTSAPEAWEEAVAVDRAIRKPQNGMRGEQYLHYRCKPLPEAIEVQHADAQLRLFNEECAGMCGV